MNGGSLNSISYKTSKVYIKNLTLYLCIKEFPRLLNKCRVLTRSGRGTETGKVVINKFEGAQ